MPLFEETWEMEDYEFRDRANLHDIPENALRAIKALPFKFEDYKANQQLACFAYERGMIECYNRYGIFGSKHVKQCLQLENWFNTCVNHHVNMDKMKTYWPEKFARHRLSRPVPNPKEVLDL